MEIQKRSNLRKLWLTITVLAGVMVILAACNSPKTPPTPAPIIACPTASAPTPVAYDDLWKSSPHADAKAVAFTHWDNADPLEIPARCAECHSRPGFLDFLGLDETTAAVVDKPAKIGTTITCYVCHNEAITNLDSVTFPSGKRISGLNPVAQCISCHAGRASTKTVEDAILKVTLRDDDTPSPNLAFVDSHSISGATSFGTDAQGAYEYAGKTYQGRFVRGGDFFNCIRCHDQHTLKIKVELCTECHTFAGGEVKNIRVNTTDFAGDGNTQEGVALEISHIHDNLYAAIQAYAMNTAGAPIVYDPKTYPYFFLDSNKNGKTDPDETNINNKYNAWTPRLLRATYNYFYVSEDPGAFAHNSTYVIQVLYDSMADIGGDVSDITRP